MLLRFHSLRKQPTFCDATNGSSAKERLRNERRNSILMTCHYPDLGSASDWLKQISHAARPIRSTSQMWVVTRHQYGISALVSQTSFRGETSGDVAKCKFTSQNFFKFIILFVYSANVLCLTLSIQCQASLRKKPSLLVCLQEGLRSSQ